MTRFRIKITASLLRKTNPSAQFVLIILIWSITGDCLTLPESLNDPVQNDFPQRRDQLFKIPSKTESEKGIPFTFSNFKKSLHQQQQHYPSSPYSTYSNPFIGHPPRQKPRPAAFSGQDQHETTFTREVAIKQGRVKGVVRSMYSQSGLRDVNQFLGLPYAESPVGNKRFMPPGAPPPWLGVKVASKLAPVCPQKLPDMSKGTMGKGRYNQLKRLFSYLKVESEDCLYLNLYVPKIDDELSARKFPVIVYIHGESYEWNSGNAYDGSVLASYGQVIVVTLNYRLGILGFMKPGLSDHIVSNFGLLDQIAALQWIKENIGAFGGDKSAVTLMGHGTGAACINFLMVSPVAEGLFHRAILMSGTACADWAITTHSLQSTLQVTQALNCPLSDNHEEVLNCLRKKRYKEIIDAKTSSPEFSTAFGPVIDGLVVPNEPHIVMDQYADIFSRYDLMFGMTELESYHDLSSVALMYGLLETERNNKLRFYMQNRYEIRPDLALVATIKEYTDIYTDPNRAKAEEHRETLLEILSDARIASPLIQTGIYHGKVNPKNYMYVFGHNSEAGDYAHLPQSVIGEELAFVFGAPLAAAGPFQTNYNAQERLLSEAVMKYWSNFAKTGNPKAPWSDWFLNLNQVDWQQYDVEWPEFEALNQSFLNLGIPPAIGYKYRHKYMQFWNYKLPEELKNIKNMKQSPPYADFFVTQNYPAPTIIPQGGTSVDPLVGHVNVFQDWNDQKMTEDPYRILKMMSKHPDMFNEMSSDNEINDLTDKIYIANDKVVTQKADVTLYALIFAVVILTILIVSFGVFIKRKFTKNEPSKLNETATLNSMTDKVTDVDESFVLESRKKKPRKQNKYESMKFCSNILRKCNGKSQNQVYDQKRKVSDWMTTQEMCNKYSPKIGYSPVLKHQSSFLKKPQKCSVAIDATPQNRSDSVLRQEPIEVTKAKAFGHESIIICRESDIFYNSDSERNSFTDSDSPSKSLHQYSNSDPVNSIYVFRNGHYEEAMESGLEEDNEQVTSFIDEDINVTSRDDSIERDPLTPLETLTNIQRRNFPKVLPDFPEQNKRHSLPPTLANQQLNLSKMPPTPPPRLATIDRRRSTKIPMSETKVAKEPPAEEQPPMASTTLIVGPLTKKSSESIYSTLKRANEKLTKIPVLNSPTLARSNSSPKDTRIPILVNYSSTEKRSSGSTDDSNSSTDTTDSIETVKRVCK